MTTSEQTTRYIEVNQGYAVIRLDVVAEDTLVTVYNVNVKDIDLLIEKLQAVKAQHAIDVKVAQYESEEPAEMTAVLGKKSDPWAWYSKALAKEVEKPVEKPISLLPALIIPMPPMPQPKREKGVINVVGVLTKDRINYGKKYPGTKMVNENADIKKGEWIRIYGISDNRVRFDKETQKQITYRTAYDRSFVIGDEVEYDSYNYSYTGKIVAIGEKTIKIEHNYGGKFTQLDLHTFIWRNWDLDLKKIAEDYQNWSMTS